MVALSTDELFALQDVAAATDGFSLSKSRVKQATTIDELQRRGFVEMYQQAGDPLCRYRLTDDGRLMLALLGRNSQEA